MLRATCFVQRVRGAGGDAARPGLPLALGAVVLANLVGEVEDTRRDYGERRVKAFGSIGGRLHVCIYTVRGDGVRRIVSLRKANRKEVRRWQGSP